MPLFCVAGSVLIERLDSQRGERVLLVDRRPHIAGTNSDAIRDYPAQIHPPPINRYHDVKQVTGQALAMLRRIEKSLPRGARRDLNNGNGAVQPVSTMAL